MVLRPRLLRQTGIKIRIQTERPKFIRRVFPTLRKICLWDKKSNNSKIKDRVTEHVRIWNSVICEQFVYLCTRLVIILVFYSNNLLYNLC